MYIYIYYTQVHDAASSLLWNHSFSKFQLHRASLPQSFEVGMGSSSLDSLPEALGAQHISGLKLSIDGLLVKKLRFSLIGEDRTPKMWDFR